MNEGERKNGNKMKIWLIIALTALTAAAAGLTSLICGSGILAPEITGTGKTEIVSIEKDTAVFDITVFYLNKNSVSAGLSSLNLDIYYNDSLLGTAKSLSKIELQPRTPGSFSLRANLKTPMLANLISEKQDTVIFILKGIAAADFGAVKIPLPVNHELVVPLRKNLDSLYMDALSNEKLITVKNAEIKSIGFTQSELRINFLISNPYGLDITLKDYPSSVYINDSYSGAGSIENELKISGKSENASGVFIFRLENLPASVNILKGLFNGSIGYYVKGTLKLETSGALIELPFTYKGKIY